MDMITIIVTNLFIQKGMKSRSYLLVVLALLTFTACGGGESNQINKHPEVVMCPNTGESCVEDHSCCAIKPEGRSDSTTAKAEDHSGNGHNH